MPEDRYVFGPCWLAFCVRGNATGVIAWGTPSASDLAELLASTATPGSPLGLRRPRYIDVRRLESAKDDAVAAFVAFFVANAALLARAFERVAIVHAGGIGQVLAAGLPSLISIPCDVSMFPTPTDAFSWIGVRSPARLAAELEELHARALGTSPMIRDLRAVLAADLRGSEIGAVARRLGQSVRSLQRKLRDEETSFQRELNACRVEAAKKLLVETDLPIDTIARDLGSTSRHFGEVFRNHTGCTPRQWRDGQRDSKPG